MTKLFSVCDDLAFLISRFYLQKVYLISILGQLLTFASEIVIIYIHHPTKKTIKVWVGKSDSVIVWNEVTLRKVDTICLSIMLMGQFEGCITVILSILVTIQDIYLCLCVWLSFITLTNNGWNKDVAYGWLNIHSPQNMCWNR